MRGIALGKSPLASSRISFGYGSGELFPTRGLGLVRIYIAPKRRTKMRQNAEQNYAKTPNDKNGSCKERSNNAVQLFCGKSECSVPLHIKEN